MKWLIEEEKMLKKRSVEEKVCEEKCRGELVSGERREEKVMWEDEGNMQRESVGEKWCKRVV